MVMSLNGFTVLAESTYDGQDEIAMEEVLVGEGGDVDSHSGEEPAPAASSAETYSEPVLVENVVSEDPVENPVKVKGPKKPGLFGKIRNGLKTALDGEGLFSSSSNEV